MEINQASDNWMVILLDSVWVIRIFQVFKIVFLLFFQVASLTRFDPQCTRLLCIFRAISAPDLFNNFNLKLPSNYAYHRAKSDCISLCMDKWWVLLKNQRFRVILMHESPLKQNHPLILSGPKQKHLLNKRTLRDFHQFAVKSTSPKKAP